jgi:hypothetical protein
MSQEVLATPHGTHAIGVAVRDAPIRDVLLALLRLNRMSVRGVGAQVAPGSPRLGTDPGPSGLGLALLIGYITSADDAEYFYKMLRYVGGAPSLVLIPAAVDPKLVKSVELRGTTVVKLPLEAGLIADAIRTQLATNTAADQPWATATPRIGVAA